jgi:hypothetical protein
MDGRDDFDFLIGTWQVHHRRLKERLKGSSEWEEFEGDTVDRKILNGLGNMDENIIYRETGLSTWGPCVVRSSSAGMEFVLGHGH